MSTPNRTVRKSAAITGAANKARTAAGKAVTRPDKPIAGTGANRIAKPTLGLQLGNKGGAPRSESKIKQAAGGSLTATKQGPVYEVPKPVRPRPQKK